MKIYKIRWFSRWATKENISDLQLIDTVDEIKRGLIDADLGAGVYKKRMALAGRGKRGGARTLIAYNFGDVIFFVYGFAKNKKENIPDKELQALKALSSNLLHYTEDEIFALLKIQELIEVAIQ